jgi:molecular chaperone GrpE
MNAEQESTDSQEQKKTSIDEKLEQCESVENDENPVEDSVEPELSYEELAEQLQQAKAKSQENWDKVLRIQADMENLKKRSRKDIENAHKFALEGFAKEMLTVIDSLELGVQAASDDAPEVLKLKEGSELTLKQFQTALTKFNIVAIDPVGEAFNPEQHQAMTMQESADVDPNTVITVFQKGYLLNGRVIRPAMVVVSKAPVELEENSSGNDQQA